MFVSERKIKSNFRGIAADVVARNVKLFSDTFISFFCSFRLLPSERRTATFHFLLFCLLCLHLCCALFKRETAEESKLFSRHSPEWKIAAHCWLIALIITAIYQTQKSHFPGQFKVSCSDAIQSVTLRFYLGALPPTPSLPTFPSVSFAFKWLWCR